MKMPKTKLPPPKRVPLGDEDDEPTSELPTLSRAYHAHVRAMATDIASRVEDGEFETAEQLSESIDEVLTGFEEDLIDQLSSLGVDPNDPTPTEEMDE